MKDHPTKGDVAAQAVQDWCKRNGFTVPIVEHRFSQKRKWRFDLAWPDDKVAIEFQGGSWVNGGHSRGMGFERDCEKLSAAAVLGWRVLLTTYRQLNSGELFAWIEAMFPTEQGV